MLPSCFSQGTQGAPFPIFQTSIYYLTINSFNDWTTWLHILMKDNHQLVRLKDGLQYIVIMPLELDIKIIKWLKQMNLIQAELTTNNIGELTYNDQIYFQNGYSIGLLLKHILKSKGFRSEALMRIRKIAHISSNENWQIIKEIMQDIHFEEEIDTHAITLLQIRNILQFLYQQFSHQLTTAPIKKEKRTYIDPATFSTDKPLQQSYNLLQFFLIAIAKVFSIPLQECLGLLIDNCKYLKKIIVQGTNSNGFEPIVEFYKLVVQNMPVVNKLIGQQNESEASFLNTLGLGVLSESSEVCEITCIVIDNLQTNSWIEHQGCNLLLRSNHDKVLDLLLRKVHPNFNIIFNEELSSKFSNKFNELTNYGKLLKYLFKSLYSREIFDLLPLNYYLKAAFEIFEPDQAKQQPKKVKLAAKALMKVIVCYFWGRLQYQQKNRICFSFSPQFCESEEQRLSTLCILFQIISELSLRQAQFVKKYYRIINQFYSKGTVDIRTFILNNLMFLYQNNPQHFPIGFFLQTYQIVTPVQTCDYQLIYLLSTNNGLLPEEAVMLLKISTIYYYQQLQAACFIQPINNILKNYTPLQWSTHLAQEILTKWPTLPIPPFQMVPPNTNKIKFRSIGLKKKEMLQFTELNRYKSILKLLTTVKSRQFLMMFGRLITSTILKVEKSKVKEMQSTKIFLNTLLAKVDSKKFQMKEQKAKESIRSKSQALRLSQVSDELQTDPFLQQYDRNDVELNTPINIFKGEQNEFMQQPLQQQQHNPLLPFTDDDALFGPSQKRYSEDALFQNYELLYIKNAANKYENLLKFASQKYEHSANLQHFLNSLNISSYFQKDIGTLKICEDRLRLSQDKSSTISFKLILQMAFLLFQFKKSRRITIKCIESFLQLLSDKNNVPSDSLPTQMDNPLAINAKIDFKYQITNKNVHCNKSAQQYVICFQVVSELLKKAIGINAVQPISCIISQILPTSNNTSPQRLSTKTMEQSRISDLEMKQYEQLQKMIEKEEKTPVKNYSTPLRMNKIKASTPIRQIKPSQKWAQVQKKVIMRRRELQGNKTINES